MRPLACLILCPALTVAFACGAAQSIHLGADHARVEGPNLKLVRPSQAGGGPAPEDQPDYLSGFQEQSDAAIFRFKCKTAGLYDISLLYRASDKKGLEVTVNGAGMTLQALKPKTSNFAPVLVGRAELLAGQNTLEIHRGWGYFDVAGVDLVPAAAPAPVAAVRTLPVDEKVTPAARELLSQLQALYGKTTLLGVYSDADADYVQQTTGMQPAVMGGDLLRYSPQFVNRPFAEPNHEIERLIEAHKRGHIITLCWHWASPMGMLDTKEEPWWKAFYTEGTRYDVQAAVTRADSPEHVSMLSDIHEIAVQLRRLQDANIPVLFRPLHEAQDRSFWWGAKGPGPFKAAWRLLYYQLTEVEGIHNLLWVFTSGGDPAWYPGDAYVDVVGIDGYPSDIHDAEYQLWADLTQQFAGRKLLTVSEFGGVPDLPRMEKMGEHWSYAVSWTGDLGPRKNTPEELKRIYADPGSGPLATWSSAAAPAPSKPAADALPH